MPGTKTYIRHQGYFRLTEMRSKSLNTLGLLHNTGVSSKGLTTIILLVTRIQITILGLQNRITTMALALCKILMILWIHTVILRMKSLIMVRTDPHPRNIHGSTIHGRRSIHGKIRSKMKLRTGRAVHTKFMEKTEEAEVKDCLVQGIPEWDRGGKLWDMGFYPTETKGHQVLNIGMEQHDDGQKHHITTNI